MTTGASHWIDWRRYGPILCVLDPVELIVNNPWVRTAIRAILGAPAQTGNPAGHEPVW